MSLLNKIFGRGQKRLFILGIDGLGLEMARQLIEAAIMPNLGGILQKGATVEMETVIPTLSRVAWPTYATGVNPGKHGIFGFVDRTPNPFQVSIPDAKDLKSPTLWELLSRAGKKVGVMNVPLTYPPRQVSGFMIAGYGGPDLAGATYPVELAPRLMELDYRVDADTSLAAEDTVAFLDDLGQCLGKRFSACFQLMHSEPWDLFQLNITSSDRINHFLWADYEEGEGGLAGDFRAFYRKLDSYLGELVQQLPGGCRLAVVSSFGFTRSQAHLYVNHWLEENGYLLFGRGKKGLLNMHPESKAYSLVPGRVFINLQGREENGSVSRGHPYEELREELIHRLGGLHHPESDQPLIKGVYKREMLYSGNQLSKAADLIIDPVPGIELKANLDGPGLLGPPHLSGMHTPRGAFFHLEGVKALSTETGASILDLAPTFFDLLGLGVPPNLEGNSLL